MADPRDPQVPDEAVEELAKLLNGELNPPEQGSSPESVAWGALIAEGNPCVVAIRRKARRYLEVAAPAIRSDERERIEAALVMVPYKVADAVGMGVDPDTAVEDEINAALGPQD